MRKEKLFSMQMPGDVKKKLYDMAKKSHRTMSAMILWLIDTNSRNEETVDIKETLDLTDDSTK